MMLNWLAVLSHAPSAAAINELPVETPEEIINNSYTLLRGAIGFRVIAASEEGDADVFPAVGRDSSTTLRMIKKWTTAAPASKRSGRRSRRATMDGVIDEDRLGLDAVYVQAKKWENFVGEPQLRDFAGALDAHRARKGVFMTTSEFSEPARRYLEKVDFKISLIDGRKLAELTIDFGVGVSLAHSYEIKKIDNDYFAEE